MFTYAQIALLLLRVAKAILDRAHDRQLVSAGEDRQIAKSLTAMAARSAVLRAIEERHQAMPPADILRELEGDFRDD